MTLRRTPFRSFAVVALAATLGACSVPQAEYHDRFPIAVSIEPQLLELDPEDRISEQTAQQVAAFAQRYRRIGEGQLTIAYPVDGATAYFVGDVSAEVAAQGVDPAKVVTGAYAPSSEGDRGVVLSFYAASASAKSCPDEWQETAANPSNQESKRLGCSHRNNLAAMVSNPRDLLEPRAPTAPDAARRSTIIENYRRGEQTEGASTVQTDGVTN